MRRTSWTLLKRSRGTKFTSALVFPSSIGDILLLPFVLFGGMKQGGPGERNPRDGTHNNRTIKEQTRGTANYDRCNQCFFLQFFIRVLETGYWKFISTLDSLKRRRRFFYRFKYLYTCFYAQNSSNPHVCSVYQSQNCVLVPFSSTLADFYNISSTLDFLLGY